jgi:hypothetical protein
MTTASNLTAFSAETQRQKKQKKTKKTKKTKNKTIITQYQMKAPMRHRIKSYKLLVWQCGITGTPIHLYKDISYAHLMMKEGHSTWTLFLTSSFKGDFFLTSRCDPPERHGRRRVQRKNKDANKTKSRLLENRIRSETHRRDSGFFQ